VSRKKRAKEAAPASVTTPAPAPDPYLFPPEGSEPPPTEQGGEPPPADQGGVEAPAVWDAEATVDLTGDDFDSPTRNDVREIVAEDPGVEIEAARDLTLTHLRGLLEALVFASDKPLKSSELARLASAPQKQVRELLAELRETYASRGVVLDEVAGGWLFRTNVQYAPFVRELASERPVRLTRAQIETLAIVAYRQPITRPEIDDIRGVDSGATLKLLLERDLVRILGKKDEPGRPLLYGTTTAFLELFGLKSLRDLPTLKEFTELSEDSRKVAEEALGAATPPGAAPDDEHDTVTPPAPTSQDEVEDPSA
jgi:segregation and condensation protein B